MRRSRATTLVTLALCALTLLLMTGAAAADYSQNGLSGLRAVAVVIENIDPDFGQRGMAASTRRTGVKLKVRQAGIRVVAPEDTSVPGAPYLYVNVRMLRPWESAVAGVVAYAIQVQLDQVVRLERDPTQWTVASTWTDGKFGVVGINKLGTLRESVRDLADKSINAYLATNQK